MGTPPPSPGSTSRSASSRWKGVFCGKGPVHKPGAAGREMVGRKHLALSTVRQCALLGMSRSCLYYRPSGTFSEDLALLKRIDRQNLVTPFYGSRRMKVWPNREGHPVSRKWVQRLMRAMGSTAIYRWSGASRPAAGAQNLSLSPGAGWRSPAPTKYGRQTSPKFPWPKGPCIWWPSWTGTAGAW